MTIVFLEGAVITLLVLTRLFRQAMLDAVPLGLKARHQPVGIGLFIAFIGFFHRGGFVVKSRTRARCPSASAHFDTPCPPSSFPVRLRADGRG